MNKLSTSKEDYIESIYLFEEKNGFSRVGEVANFLGVKLPSVNKAIKELEERKLVVHQKYGYIKLTDEGRKIALSIINKHNSLRELFNMLGISSKNSQKYACYIEHIIEKRDYDKVIKLTNYLKNNRSVFNDIRKELEE
jgi:Mn-dependent DtxR family transcriptional regulator